MPGPGRGWCDEGGALASPPPGIAKKRHRSVSPLHPPHNQKAVVLYGYHPLTRFRLRALPGPRPRWLTGNVREVFAAGMPEAYRAWAATYGPLFRVYYGAAPAVVISDPATIKAIQLSQATRPALMSPIDLTLNRQAAAFHAADMLVTRDRALHKDVKAAAFLPMFRGPFLAAYAPLMLNSADRLADRLAAVAETGAEVDIWRLLGAMTMEVVLACAFGVQVDAQATSGATDAAGVPVPCCSGPLPPSVPPRPALGGFGDASSGSDSSDDADPGSAAEAAALLDAARTLFQTPGRASPYFLIAQALPPALRPLVRLFATLAPDAALRRVNAARALTQGTVLELVRDTRAAAELRACADCTAGKGKAKAKAGGGGGGGGAGASRAASPARPGQPADEGAAAAAAAAPSPSPPATPSRDGEAPDGGTAPAPPAPPAAAAPAALEHPLVRMRRASEDASWLEAEVEAAARAAADAKRPPSAQAAAAVAARRKLAALPGSFLAHVTTVRRADGSLFTDVECAQTANTMLLAAYETTANALSITLYETARAPRAWARLVAEVEAVLGGRDPTPADLDALPYLSACFKEALRLSPPGSATIREASRDLLLHGHLIPKGTAIHNAVFTAQRDPAVWGADADEFVPERWTDPARGPPPDLLAFGGGALMCAGQRFALEEAKMTLVRLAARGLSFELSPGQVPLAMHAPLTYGPAKGVFVRPRLDAARAAADAAARRQGKEGGEN